MNTSSPRRRLAVVAAGVCVAFLVAATATLAGSNRTTRSFPISALGGDEHATSVPTQVLAFIERAAAVTGSDAAALRSSVRLVRANVGIRHAAVYAFADVHGRPCFIMTGLAGACATASETSTPGLYWLLGGGQLGLPSVLLGIANDDVARVALVIDGESLDIALEDNVAFAEFRPSANRATITVMYTDGTSASAALNLSG